MSSTLKDKYDTMLRRKYRNYKTKYTTTYYVYDIDGMLLADYPSITALCNHFNIRKATIQRAYCETKQTKKAFATHFFKKHKITIVRTKILN